MSQPCGFSGGRRPRVPLGAWTHPAAAADAAAGRAGRPTWHVSRRRQPGAAAASVRGVRPPSEDHGRHPSPRSQRQGRSTVCGRCRRPKRQPAHRVLQDPGLQELRPHPVPDQGHGPPAAAARAPLLRLHRSAPCCVWPQPSVAGFGTHSAPCQHRCRCRICYPGCTLRVMMTATVRCIGARYWCSVLSPA